MRDLRGFMKDTERFSDIDKEMEARLEKQKVVPMLNKLRQIRGALDHAAKDADTAEDMKLYGDAYNKADALIESLESEELVERVARAICVAAGHSDPDLEMECEPLWDEFTEEAKAAIKALAGEAGEVSDARS